MKGNELVEWLNDLQLLKEDSGLGTRRFDNKTLSYIFIRHVLKTSTELILLCLYVRLCTFNNATPTGRPSVKLNVRNFQ